MRSVLPALRASVKALDTSSVKIRLKSPFPSQIGKKTEEFGGFALGSSQIRSTSRIARIS